MSPGLNLSDLLPLDRAETARLQKQTEARIMAEGACAYDLGWPVTSCPPFKVPDHAWAWRQGWRNAQERAGKRSRK